ncbi:MAG: hypothetical protein AAGF45_03445 [Pseudomonadota bacterium]
MQSRNPLPCVTTAMMVLAMVVAGQAGGLAAPASAQEAAGTDVAQLGIFDRLRGGGRRGGNCMDPSASSDQDVRRNSAAISNARLCVTQDSVTDGGLTWRFTIVSSRARGPVWYMPHDDETQAFDAAIYAVARYGGRLVAVDGNERRQYRGIDGNRHFARDRSAAARCGMRGPSTNYTRFVMGQFRGQRHVLSIHNNTRGGGVSVNMRSAKNTGFRARGRFSDPDHLVFIAGKQPIASSREGQTWRDRLLRAGLNVVYEHVTPRNNDCSMSNYVALNDGRPYFNIEAVHGSRIQKGMVDALMAMLGYRPR